MAFHTDYTSVYSNPEKFGLTVLIEKEDPGACYSFDTVIVWEDANGRLYWAADAGCSCPSPFEDFTSLENLGTGDVFDLFRFLSEWIDESYSPSHRLDSAHEVLRKVSRHLSSRDAGLLP